MCEHFNKGKEHIRDTRYWIEYVAKNTLINDNKCKDICSDSQIRVCDILQEFSAFDNIKEMRESQRHHINVQGKLNKKFNHKK
mgnify:CR=1 FL=1